MTSIRLHALATTAPYRALDQVVACTTITTSTLVVAAKVIRESNARIAPARSCVALLSEPRRGLGGQQVIVAPQRR